MKDQLSLLESCWKLLESTVNNVLSLETTSCSVQKMLGKITVLCSCNIRIVSRDTKVLAGLIWHGCYGIVALWLPLDPASLCIDLLLLGLTKEEFLPWCCHASLLRRGSAFCSQAGASFCPCLCCKQLLHHTMEASCPPQPSNFLSHLPFASIFFLLIVTWDWKNLRLCETHAV